MNRVSTPKTMLDWGVDGEQNIPGLRALTFPADGAGEHEKVQLDHLPACGRALEPFHVVGVPCHRHGRVFQVRGVDP